MKTPIHDACPACGSTEDRPLGLGDIIDRLRHATLRGSRAAEQAYPEHLQHFVAHRLMGLVAGLDATTQYAADSLEGFCWPCQVRRQGQRQVSLLKQLMEEKKPAAVGPVPFPQAKGDA